MAETGKTVIQWVLVIAGVWFLLVATPAVLNVFRLDGSDTLQDFKKASVGRQVSFLMKLCHDGVCIEKVAWRCGFSLTEKLAPIVSTVSARSHVQRSLGPRLTLPESGAVTDPWNLPVIYTVIQKSARPSVESGVCLLLLHKSNSD